jgi:hypothetical protein
MLLITTLAVAATAAAEAATAFAAAAETTTAATAAAAEAAAWALFLRAGLIDRQLTAAEVDTIAFFSRDLGLFGRAHGHEGETARAARHSIHGDVNVGHGTILAKMRTQFVLSRFEREVSNV